MFATAAAGALAGHWLSYVLTYGDPRRRDAVLAATGHGYLPFAWRLAIVGALAGIGAVLVRALDVRARGPVASPDVRRSSRGDLVLRLWALQATAFCALELGERMASGAPIAGVFRADLLLVGIAAQLLLAIAGAALLRLVHRVALVLAAPRPAPHLVAGSVAVPPPRAVGVRRGPALAAPAAPRAPPLAS